jgi:hypothetical protein
MKEKNKFIQELKLNKTFKKIILFIILLCVFCNWDIIEKTITKLLK